DKPLVRVGDEGSSMPNERYSVATDLELGGTDHALIIDVRDSPVIGNMKLPFNEHFVLDPRIQFLVISDDFNADNPQTTGFKGIRLGETVRLGSNHHQGRFQYSDKVDGDQAEITLSKEGELSIK